ncbi:MAG: Fic family protein [Lachnospiraceae bacterium]|nr:Fic family protein [Lachnospiraceae bacterium]
MQDNGFSDSKYCYPGTNVLKNKLNIRDAAELFEAEKKLTSIRLEELQDRPVTGRFGFAHLKKIHGYIFQDVYDWAGKERTVEISKSDSLFCTLRCMKSYADTVFAKYFPECYKNKDSIEDFVEAFSNNYGDLNALHPFREGNGRAQREFARMICLKCGYAFDLSCTTHKKMVSASQISLRTNDNGPLKEIFKNAIMPLEQYESRNSKHIYIFSSDDLSLESGKVLSNRYEDEDSETVEINNSLYEEKIRKMNEE